MILLDLSHRRFVGEFGSLHLPFELGNGMDLRFVAQKQPAAIEDGKIYGRGAVDAKGPLAAGIIAASNLIKKRERGRIIVLACSEKRVQKESSTS